MGEDFRGPTPCTAVAMRKFHPGLESYKLSRLCAELGISLDQYHRALCDAEVTADLLKLIKGKRAGNREWLGGRMPPPRMVFWQSGKMVLPRRGAAVLSLATC